MKRLVRWMAVALVLAAPGLVYADGEATAELSDSGIIVPIDVQQAEVVDQRVTVTLPPPRLAWERPATIRAEYVLRNRGRAPLRMVIGWPVSGAGYGGGMRRAGVPAVKLDGKPIRAVFLSFSDLADPYVQEWLGRIDKLLEAKPALREQVLAARRGAAGHNEWAIGQAAGKLARWLEAQHEIAATPDALDIAAGLAGAWHSGLRRDTTVQMALHWLDPTYESVDVYALLAERWDQEPRLLDPVTDQLMDTRGDMLVGEPSFGIFRFPVTLKPGGEHRLVVQYRQYLGWVGRPNSWHGLAYVMEPAQRWGRWGRTTIEVLVPRQWQNVAIRPTAQKVGARAGRAVYRIRMGRPSENLYVSVDHDSRTTALWSRRAGTLAGLWRGREQDEAVKELLRYGRGPATAAMTRLISELPASDGRCFIAGFVLYVLDLDRTLGRSVMIEACAPGKSPDFGEASALLAAAYRHRPDARLISAGLDLTPHVGEGMVLGMRELLLQLAEESPRDLLTALRGKPRHVWDGTARVLYGRGKQGELVAYRGLEQVAKDEGARQRRGAQRLIAAMEAIWDRDRAAEQRERQRRAQLPVRLPEGVTLPIGAARALQVTYLDWSILYTSSFDDQAVAYVRDHSGAAAGPQYCQGDFDGNGLGDAAVLIVHADHDEVRLVALRQTAEDQWTTEDLADLSYPPRSEGQPPRLLVFVTPRAPGEVAYWTDQEKSGSLDLAHDGIELHYVGKASVLYYWNGGGWGKVQTGD